MRNPKITKTGLELLVKQLNDAVGALSFDVPYRLVDGKQEPIAGSYWVFDNDAFDASERLYRVLRWTGAKYEIIIPYGTRREVFTSVFWFKQGITIATADLEQAKQQAEVASKFDKTKFRKEMLHRAYLIETTGRPEA